MSWDVIVIGSGAGGSTLAWRLAQSDKRVLVIERGDYLPREAENWDPRAVMSEGRYGANETWYDRDGQAFSPYTHYCVGGNTKMYGAALLRMRQSDFGAVRHLGGLSPAWPITYADLEPYYCEAEQLYSVHGRRGIDPLDPPASLAYPFDAVEHEPRIAELYEDLEALGHRPYPLPLALRRHGEAPVRLGRFDGYPDPTETKADAHVCALRPALARPGVELWTRTRVERLLASPSGREIVGVEVVRERERMTVHAHIVVVACGAINSAALLLRSHGDAHPRGLANGSDQVGRNYMTHHNGLFIAYGEAKNESRFGKTFGVGDFYRGAGPDDPPLGSIQLMGRMDEGGLAAMAREQLPGVPVAEIAAHSLDIFLTTEDLPVPDNRIALRDDGGVQVAYRPTNLEAYDRLRRATSEMLTAADLRHGRRAPQFLHTRLGIGGVTHQCGTIRCGHDAHTSVLDASCRAHEVDNLYVADGSVFPSSAAVNPSLTIMANALRVADHIRTRL
ncbi:MAG TPA: GMC family oxidoreductase [Nannocystaceae bacterium]|nr:GMC family oxidoreductase [Nannocystaceae bacterium]